LIEPLDADTSWRRIWGLNPNVFFLGMVSLLTDVSSEMIFTLVPLFLRNVLGAPFTAVGLIGGLSESTDAVFRIFSGRLSDRIGKRKLLAVLGYVISTVAKPFMYVAGSWGVVLGVRFGDRVGKGIRTSSRDALIADSTPAGKMGMGFGLHRAMDTFGAVLGLAIAALSGVDKAAHETAIAIGASQFQAITIVIREARFAIYSALIMGFGRAISEVGLALMVGGNIRGYTRVMTTAISLETSKGDIVLSIALGIILISLALIINFALNRLQQR